MTTATIAQQIDDFEIQIGHDLSYLRAIMRGSEQAIEKFFAFIPLAHHRDAASKEALTVARLVGTRHEDCGPCLQIVVDLAKADGVAAEIMQPVLDRRPQDLPPNLQKIYAFAEAVCNQSDDLEELRLALEADLGHSSMVDLTLGIASTRVFPIVKRGLGLHQSCSLVKVTAA